MISAIDIADALFKPRPTQQQRAVIEAPLTPALVVAGAGSGKTETMANRVLWLIANGHATAGQILGLTFTRKAASELSDRIRSSILALHHSGMVPGGYDEFDPPAVSTYNSFANRIYRDHAILIGRDGDATVLTEASAWQLARSLVVRSRVEGLTELDKQIDTVTKAVLSLSGDLSENVTDPVAVKQMAEQFAELRELPAGGRGAYQEVLTLIDTVAALPVLCDLAVEFSAQKARRGFVEYSDQVALALEIASRVPRVAADYREQYPIVLLDEYQDTSVVQTRLLATLFAGHPVMAVGDPHQSIYGWRGASAANLDEFGTTFGAGESFALSTSWRNGHHILRVANVLVHPLRAESRVPVRQLEAGPNATSSEVEVSFTETVLDEAREVARWFRLRLAECALVRASTPPSAAILFRARKTMGFFIDALREEGVPFHVLGIGGLLSQPEIADLVCALTVLSDPTAGSELIRLLAGSRWRIGPRDLHQLGRLASWLRDRDYAQHPYDDELKQRMRTTVAESEGGSIVDALDFIAAARPGHTALDRFSEIGLERLRDAGQVLARLRTRSMLDLVDFVTLVEQELLLDIEILANESRVLGTANLDALFDALSGYLAIDDSATLGGFLGWLREAEWRDGLSPRPEDPEPGTVQLLTIHGAKGLEWDLVAVPRMVDDELPGAANGGYTGWLSFGALPYEFRGDSAELPAFDWRAALTRKELLDAKNAFSGAVKQHHVLEERRLAYVAVTRARHNLLMSGSFWASQKSHREPSEFLRQLAGSGIIGELPDAPDSDTNPLADRVSTFIWPRDPLGNRRKAVTDAAAHVHSARPGTAGPWQAQVELLLAERAARLAAGAGGRDIDVPTRVAASRFKDFVTNPGAVASALRRPIPERPYRATRLGTLFHTWVEARYGASNIADLIDALPIELDGEDELEGEEFGGDHAIVANDDARRLALLQSNFERSQWASVQPIDVEREIHLPLSGQLIVCKIDAVFERGGRIQIVDWKTGKAPVSAKDLEEKQLQLALYRLAYAKWRGIDPALIDAVFYYVADDTIIEPKSLPDEAEIIALWRASVA